MNCPLSLKYICRKLWEHVVASNKMKHLEQNQILYDLQYGFPSSRSCETQLISFIQGPANNKNIQIDIIIMDFAKPFVKVSHHHLINKIDFCGINCNVPSKIMKKPNALANTRNKDY